MLLSETEPDVLEAAERLGEALTAAQSETDSAEFDSILEDCTEAISQRTGVEYGSVCDTGGGC